MNISAQPSDWENPIQLPEVTTPARVLVPFDGSHNAERALAWAAYVAQAGGQELVVVVAYEQPTTMRGRGAQYVEEVREHLEREATGLASEATVLMQERGVSARAIVIRGDIARSILDVAESERCGLVILGRQGISAELGGVASAIDRVRDLMQGGVAEKVVRHAPVPVLVVP